MLGSPKLIKLGICEDDELKDALDRLLNMADLSTLVGSTSWRDQFLGGMYDAQMLAVKELGDAELADLEAPAINARTRGLGVVMGLLASDDEFVSAVTAGTNTPARLKYRVQKVTEALRTA